MRGMYAALMREMIVKSNFPVKTVVFLQILSQESFH